MLNTVFAVGAVLLGVTMWLTAIHYALREVSIARLTKALTARHREDELEYYQLHFDGYLLTTATLRMASLLGLVLAISEAAAQYFPDHRGRQYLAIFLVAGMLISIFGVVIPHAWAKYAGEVLLVQTLRLVRWMHVPARPLIVCFHLLDSLVRRLAGVPKSTDEDESEQIEQEVLDAVSMAEIQGAVDETERAMIRSVMQLDETTAGQIMTPRIALIAVPHASALDELKEVIHREGHSRIPVYEDTIDKILGLVYAKDLLQVDPTAPFRLIDHLRTVPFVPESKLLRDLLQEFRTGQTHAAIVLDEYGGTAGLVTIEDILEELVGEIVDEYELPEPQSIQPLGPQSIEVDSKVHVSEINEQLELHIPEDEDYETIGGFVFATLGKIPLTGETLRYDGVEITILEAEERRIIRLRLERTTQVDPVTPTPS
ncbi:MAG: hypothetical protein HJJLKODD_01857 [Phycisphaerae bacterium]|nr:hypothetical protein [Phycisphaerae bacterium]